MTTAPEPAVSLRSSSFPAGYLPGGGQVTGKQQADEADLSLLCKQVMHDVRGDLVSLAIMAKLLQRGSHGPLPDRINDQMAALEKKANAAADLLENYCRLAAVTGKGSLSFDERLDCLHDVLIPVEQELAMELANKKVALRYKATGCKKFLVDGNKLLLQSVFRTLLHNAIRHSTSKSTITCALEGQGEQVKISISNEGTVVPEHLRHRIFKEFTKAESARSAATAGNGLGLGLYLGRNIIDRHGGAIWYEPMPTGSKFVLTLPAAA